MKTKRSYTLAAALICLGWAFTSGIANAESDMTGSEVEMHKACAEQGGRFEQSWLYNDQGTQWGRVVSCSTDVGTVICRDKVCQSTRRERPGGATAPGNGTGDVHGTELIPNEAATFASLLATLAEK